MASVELTWLGHACWLVKSGEHSLVIDPFLDDSPTAPVNAEDLNVDFVLVSHGHFDHVADAARIASRTGATVVANFEICQWLGKQGIEKTQPMNLGAQSNFPGVA